MPHFLRLPSEIRIMIYEYCLVVEGEINPYPTDYERNELMRPFPRKPDVALLQVSSVVQAEAKIVLFGKNLWRLSYNKKNDPMWDAYGELVRKLIISFDVRDLDSNDRLQTAIFEWGYQDNWEDLKDKCHNQACNDLIDDVWWWKISRISEMMLTGLILDFTNCYCPNGCC